VKDAWKAFSLSKDALRGNEGSCSPRDSKRVVLKNRGSLCQNTSLWKKRSAREGNHLPPQCIPYREGRELYGILRKLRDHKGYTKGGIGHHQKGFLYRGGKFTNAEARSLSREGKGIQERKSPLRVRESASRGKGKVKEGGGRPKEGGGNAQNPKGEKSPLRSPTGNATNSRKKWNGEKKGGRKTIPGEKKPAF